MNLRRITEAYYRKVRSCFSRSMGLRRSTRNLLNQEVQLEPVVDHLDGNRGVSPICLLPRNRGYRAEIGAFVLGIAFLSIAFTVPPLKHSNHGSQKLIGQVGLLLWFGLAFLVAEICRRLCLFLEEVTHLTSRYEGSLSRLMLRIFSARHSANFAAVVLLLSLLFITHADSTVLEEIRSHWPTFIGLCGLYLLFLAVIKITENLVDRDVLLDDRFVMPIGHGLAYSYYYGYLKIILPASENNTSLRERAVHFEFEERITLASRKLIILIPDSCYCTPSFQDMASSGQIERVMPLQDVLVSRAGMKARPYSTTVYLIQPEGKPPIYVMLEMPSILYALYEMNTTGTNSTKLSAFERTQQAQAFYRVLSRLLDEDPACRGMCEIVYYKDQNINLAEVIYNHVSSTAFAL